MGKCLQLRLLSDALTGEWRNGKPGRDGAPSSVNPGDSTTRQEVSHEGPPTRTWFGGYHLARSRGPPGPQTSNPNTPQHDVTRQAQRGTPRHDTAQHQTTLQGTPQHSTDQHDAAGRTTAHHSTKARATNRGSNPTKPPHTPEGAAPARHTGARGHCTRGNDSGGRPTQTAARKLIPATRRRRDTESPSPPNPGPQEAAWRNRPAGRART